MISPVRLLPLIGSLLSVVSGKPTSKTSSEVLLPSEDPFYSAPNGYENRVPGSVLRIRSAPGNLTTLVNASAAYNIVYRTTDSRYNPSWAVTTVFVPLNPRREKTSSLLSYQIAYDSHDLDASPSYAMYASPPTDVILALEEGWYVNVPDYEGPLASFTAGVQSGHATLDSIRSILYAEDARLDLETESSLIALWGYSGGALASEWATELQVQYAPELTIAGAALGGLTPNITSVMDTVSGGYSAGLIPEAILGIASQYPATYKYLVGQLNAEGKYNRTTFLAAAKMTLSEASEFFVLEDVFDYFVDGEATFKAAVVQHALNRDGYMGYHGVPQTPIYAYKAINDEVSPIADTDALVERYCGVGVNILYERNTIGGHSAEGLNGHASALAFVAAVLGGTYSKTYETTGCTIKNVTIDLSSSPL
ncbi:hypothetical protein N7454_007124 [Penicillium verhagenii]|nr:hypothetical protein N7454_007124 [Penicillium verhagenii]